MTGTTNPYQTWLGLNVAGRPDCYTLLGLSLYESDAGKILAAAQNATARASIPMAPADEPLRHTLISEIQTAQACLLDPAQKQAYDQQLRAYYNSQANTPEATPIQMASPVATPVVATPVAAPAAKSSDSTGEPLIQARKQSAASTAKNRARNSALTTYGILALVLVAGIGAGGYYFFVVLPAQQLAAKDDNDPPKPPSEKESSKPTAGTEGTPTGSKTPKEKRPTPEELASSIPELGDPNEAMPSMDEPPGMMNNPSKPAATPQQQAELETALKNAWEAIGSQEYANASVALNVVRETPKTDEGKLHFEQVDRLVQDLRAYQKALIEGTSSLQVGEELTVGSTKFKIEIINNDRVVVSFDGQNKPFELNSLPDGFRRAIAISRLTGDANTKKRVEASYLLLSPKADIEYVRQLWMQSGSDGGALATLEADQKKYTSNSMIASTGENFTGNMASPSNGENAVGSMMPQTDGADSQSLAGLLARAREQLTDRNPSAAQQTLAQAAVLASAPTHQQKVKSLQQLADWNVRFWEAVSKQLTKLPADEDLDVKGTITRVVESDASRLVIRVAGENRRYTLSDLPAGLAKFLAEMELPPNIETKKTIGAFLMVTADNGAERASQEWSTAFMSQEEIDQLVAAYSAPLDLEGDLIEPAAIPSDTDLAPAGEALAQVWTSQISSAKSGKDHIQIARKLQENAKSQTNGSAAQFVAYRLALAEGARGGDFELCSSIIDDWQTRFAISPGEWHLKAIQLAGGSSDSATMHAAIARHAIEQIPLQRAAGQEQLGDTMLNIAVRSAAKSRDKSLIEAVKQLQAAS